MNNSHSKLMKSVRIVFFPIFIFISLFKSFYKNFKIVKYVLKFCPWYVIFSVLYIIASLLNSVSKVFLIKEAIELVVNNNPFSEVFNALLIYMIVIIVATIIRTFYSSHVSSYYRIVYTNKIQNLMYSKTRHVDYSDFDNPEFYDQYARALRDGSTRGIRVYEDLVNFVSSLVITLAIGSIIFISDKTLILIIIIASILSVIFTNLTNKSMYKLDKRTEKNRRMYRYVNRTFYQQKYAAEIKTTPISDLLIENYKVSAKIINKEYIRTQKVIAIFNIFNNISSILIEQGGTYIFLTRKLFKNLIPISEFTSVLNASLQFSNNFVSAINFLTRVKVNALYIDDFLWYMNYRPKLETKGEEQIEEELESIDIENIKFRYPESEVYNLDDLNLKINKGQKLAIVGLNGAGKTTLIKLLLKFYQQEEGLIYFNQQNYIDLDETKLRKQFSIIFQDFQTYALSIAENVLMREVESFDDEELVWECLEKVGLKEKVERLPDNIYTIVTREFDDKGAVFSGGERQKLVIARVFASNASLYVLDEPTASLDPIAEKSINDLLIQNATNKTIIIIAHRLSTVVDVDHIILIENGKIIEEGNHNQLIEKKGKYFKMFNTQASLYKKNNDNNK